MPGEDDPPNRPKTPGVSSERAGDSSGENAAAPKSDANKPTDSQQQNSPALDETLAAGSSDSRMRAELDKTASPTPALEKTLSPDAAKDAPLAVGSIIRKPKPLTETVSGDSDPAIEVPDQRVGRYVLKKRLGAGGMGVVYKATDSELGRDVAIKMIKSGTSSDRLKREAQALARLDHPNVVTVYDVGEQDGRVFVAMELIDGANFHQWCDERERTTEEIMRVLLEAANGIIAAHEAGMIHRDLKPDNIFISKSGAVSVGDFGLARDASDDDTKGFDSMSPAASLTKTGHVLGTPAYMAPEQADGEATERSDQFSFCVTAYEALYGTRPFVGTTFQDILDHVESGEIAAPKRPRKVPPRIARAIRRGLSADPAKRWSSMRWLVAALRNQRRPVWPWLAGAGVLAIGATVAIIATRDDDANAAESCAANARDEMKWSGARHTALVARLKGESFPPSAAEEIAKRLDAYAVRWRGARNETCVAIARHQLDERTRVARSTCQTLARTAFDDAVNTFETGPYLEVMPSARHAASLPAVEGCAGDDALKLAVASADHERLMRELLRNYAMDLAAFASLRTRAEAANDQSALLEISLSEARRAIELGSYAVAEAALQRGMPIAEQLDAGGARARLLSLAASVRCTQSKDPEPFLSMAIAAGKRLDPARNALEITAVLEGRSACLIRATDPSPAIPILEELIQRVESHGSDLDQITPHSDLALVLRRLGRAEEAAKHEAIVLAILGRYTNDTSVLAQQEANESNAAFMAGDLHTAIAHQQRATQLFTQQIHKGQAHATLAMYYDVLADYRSAVTSHDAAIAILSTLPMTEFTENYLAEAYTYGGADSIWLDDINGAADRLERGLQLATKYEKTELIAVAQLGLGRVALARKDHPLAVRTLLQGLATHAKLGEAAQFRVAIGLHALAQAHWALGDRFAAREAGKAAETAMAKGIEQAKENKLGAFSLPFRLEQAKQITDWNETHK